MARISFFRIFFPKKSRYPKAAKATSVLTNTVELAMDVLLRDSNHTTKCMARNRPERPQKARSFPFKESSSFLVSLLEKISGVSKSTVQPSR